MYVKRLLVPMSCCDEAATYVIDVLGGEQKTRELVGGTKWWQVRGLKGYVAGILKTFHKLTLFLTIVWTRSGLFRGKIMYCKGDDEGIGIKWKPKKKIR